MSLGIVGLVAGAGGLAGPHVEGPPPAHTGGFGEPTCVACHLGSDLNQPGSTLEIIGLSGTYSSGTAYEVTVRILSFDMQAAGFQGAFRWAEGENRGRGAGRVKAGEPRVNVVEGENGVQYVQHTPVGVPADGETAEWTFTWTAPVATGAIDFHVAANSGNGDNSPLDDLVYTLSVHLKSSGPPVEVSRLLSGARSR
jgi:hypothetical protein